MADAIDPNSPTWRAVKAWATSRREASRNALEGAGLGPLETEYERGRIAALKELLALGEPKIKTAFSDSSE